MKKIGSLFALVLSIIILAGIPVISTSAGDTITVSLRIEGLTENLYYDEAIELNAEEPVSLAKLLESVSGNDGAPIITIEDGEYGAYVADIGGLSQFAHGSASGWLYRANGVEASFGPSEYELNDGDAIVYYYGDPYGVGMQYPVADVRTENGDYYIVRFTSEDTEYDDNWNPSVSKNPVTDAAVNFDGDEYITDEFGEIRIYASENIAGFHEVQIHKYHEDTGVPLVLRFEPGYEMFIPFCDTDPNEEYGSAVEFAVRAGLLKGIGKNMFAPDAAVTIEQLLMVLYRMSGETESGGEFWYSSALAWAENLEIIDNFIAGENVSRETLVALFNKTTALLDGGTFDAADYSDIGGDNALSRADVCRILERYYR